MGKGKRVKSASGRTGAATAGEKPAGHMKNENVILLVAIALVVGFFAGTAFTIYRTGSSDPAPSGTAAVSQLDRMRAALEDRTRNNPEDAEAWIQLGNLYFDSNEYKKAIFAYEKGLELNPGNADILTDLGVMYRRDGQPEKAVEAFDRAIAADSRHEASRFNKGIVLMHDLKDIEGAIAAWEELLEINPIATAPNGVSVDQLIQKYRAAGGPQ